METHRVVVVLGDFNSRLGCINADGSTRFTEDHTLPAHARPAGRELRSFCSALGLAPTHGRHAASPGRATCASANTTLTARSESDYVLVSSDLLDFEVLPPQEWATRPSAHAHTLVAVQLSLRPFVRADSAETPKSVRPSMTVAPYGAHEYDTIAHSIAAGITSGACWLRDNFVQTVLHAGTRALGNPESVLRSRVYRQFQGLALPPHLVAMREQCRALRRLGKRLARTDVAASAQAYAEARTATRAANRACHEFVRTQQQRGITASLELRRRDPFAFWRLFRSTAPENPHCHADHQRIPDRLGVPALSGFTSHFRRLFAETRTGLLPGVTDAGWLQWVPRACHSGRAGPDIGGEFTWQEVYLCLFPPSKRMQPSPCCADCAQCREYGRDWLRWKRDSTGRVEPPQWKPCLSTSKAAGPDGLPAELLSWARPDRIEDRHRYRRLVATAIATIFNAQLNGPVSAEWVRSVLTPVLKHAKPGQTIDPGDPDVYRGIAVGNTLSKLLSLVLISRLSHFLAVHGIISREQVGFLWRHAAEEHVFTLTQSLKARLRAGASTHVLFVDLRKAYDKVHLATLWRVLEVVGVPDRIVALLRGMAAVRTTQVRVNGELSEPIPYEAGVPQGDPLSCLLFLVFIESLSRYLAAHLPGVDALGVRIKHLLFADDLAALSDTPEGLQHALELVGSWCAAWGMEMGIGQGKTEALSFLADGAPEPRLELRHGTQVVPWGTSYRYLGFMTSTDLSEHVMIERLLERLRSGLYRYFTRNETLRRSPVATQLQVYRTTTLVATEYLRCILSLSSSTCAKLDTECKRVARAILGIPVTAANALAWGATALLPAEAICLRERERLRLTLEHTPHRDSLAAELYAALQREPHSRASTRGPLANWAHATAASRDRAAQSGAVFVAPTCYSDISRVAHVAARSYANAVVKRELDEHLRRRHGTQPATTAMHLLSSRPSSVGSAAHARYLSLGMAYNASLLGEQRGSTPASIVGPGCHGALLALAHSGRYPAVASAQLGLEATSRWPFADRPVAADRELWRGAQTYKQRFVPRACRLCRGRDSIEDIFHLACECPHPAMRAAQAGITAALVSTVWVR